MFKNFPKFPDVKKTIEELRFLTLLTECGEVIAEHAVEIVSAITSRDIGRLIKLALVFVFPQSLIFTILTEIFGIETQNILTKSDDGKASVTISFLDREALSFVNEDDEFYCLVGVRDDNKKVTFEDGLDILTSFISKKEK